MKYIKRILIILSIIFQIQIMRKIKEALMILKTKMDEEEENKNKEDEL